MHRLVGTGTATTRLDVSRARGLTRFVGRDADMATLEAALAEAQAGHGQVVGVVAAAGTGKSRLCCEFAERCRARGITVNEGHARRAREEHSRTCPMLEVFRAYFGITERDDDATAREKIAGRLLLLDEGFRDVLPVMFEFLRVPDPERPVPRMDPEAKQRQLFAVVRRVVQDRRAGADRVFALIEDLHWFDPAQRGAARAVGRRDRRLVEPPRRELPPRVPRRVDAEVVLSAAAAGAARQRRHPRAARRSARRPIRAFAGWPTTSTRAPAATRSSPRRSCRRLIESGNLQGTRGSYRLTHADRSASTCPPSVQALLGARIDRLPEREKQVLQTAAVIGKEFAEPILRQVLAATGRTPLADGRARRRARPR